MGKLTIKNYNKPAPRWLRILRDSWNLIGTGIIAYLEVFKDVNVISEATLSILVGTIAFIGMVVTVSCIFIEGKANEQEVNT